jgi:hypothetical protein
LLAAVLPAGGVLSTALPNGTANFVTALAGNNLTITNNASGVFIRGRGTDAK